MKLFRNLFFTVLIVAGISRLGLGATLENNRYRLEMRPDGTIELANKAVPGGRVFVPKFTVVRRADDPKFRISTEKEIAYPMPSWNAQSGGQGTRDFFDAGENIPLIATTAKQNGNAIEWGFAGQEDFSLRAELVLPPGTAEPTVTFHFTPKKSAWYSIGYTGAPQVSPDQFDGIWQPMVWQEKRFPARSFLSDESMCSLPAVLVSQNSSTFGVVVDPAEIPFRQATHGNSLFGVVLRNREGNAQPMIFAPVFGQPGSKMAVGQTQSFSFRLFVYPGDCLAAYQTLAREVFGFHNYRENATCSLNQTLENMISFAMNDQFCGWLPEQKAADYATDIPGTVKNVSALHPLSLALITDNEEIYRRRALPMTEYLLSREKYLFALRPGITRQGASRRMKGPAAEVAELVSLHQMFHGDNDVFRHYALELYDQPRALNLNMISEAASWQNSLALYRLTGEKEYLAKAVSGANHYIARRIEAPQTDFSDAHIAQGGQFWTDFDSKWVDLFELYEETKDPRHLKAALAGARSYTTYARMEPSVPEGNVVVNPGGRVGIYYARNISNPQPMRAPEQMVPAWRVSPVGLTPEASTTYSGNPAIFLSHYAAYLLRVGHLAKEPFLEDVGRAAVVGRYANFPGYTSKNEYTTIYQRPDYPLRPWRELTYNDIYFNHIWPNLALLMDFLVSDAWVKSEGRIHFPSRYAPGYAYLQSKVYGDRPGVFYGDENVRLWLPAKLLGTDSIQANYIAGYGNGNFYAALLNQSAKPLTVTITLNPDIVPLDVNKSYSVQFWEENRPGKSGTLRAGQLTVSLAGYGITAFKIEGLKVSPQFQDQTFKPASASSPQESFAIQETAFGKVTAMLLSISPSLTSAYIWLAADPSQVSQATLHCQRGKVVTTMMDADYPFEFSVPLTEKELGLECWVEATTVEGKVIRSEPILLKR